MPSLSQQISSAGSEQQSPASIPSTNPTPGQAGIIQTNQTPVPATGGGLRPQPQQVQQNREFVQHAMPSPTAAPTSAGPVDWAKAKDYLDSTMAFYQQHGGKIGCNPYFYIHSKVRPLETAFLEKDKMFNYPGGQTKEQWEQGLYNSIMALEQKKSYAMHDPEAYKQEQERQAGVLQAKQSGVKQILFN